MARVLKWEDIADRLAAGVSDGTFPAGTLLPSIADLADTEGVSQATVRRALTHLAETGAITAEHGVGHRVTRHPAPVTRSLEDRVTALERAVADHERRLPPPT